MSKLLNLITYSLACLLIYINYVLSCICERVTKHTYRISVAFGGPSDFIYAYFG
jgi:hypothetical protein